MIFFKAKSIYVSSLSFDLYKILSIFIEFYGSLSGHSQYLKHEETILPK